MIEFIAVLVTVVMLLFVGVVLLMTALTGLFTVLNWADRRFGDGTSGVILAGLFGLAIAVCLALVLVIGGAPQ